ncbi:MAG: amidohydrolase [Dehalococcoidia bacterium]
MSKPNSLTVFRARRIITMEPGWPEATAVAVRDGRVVAVGELDELRPWLDASPHTFDDRFADRVLLPGFIDPHLHPSLAAFLLSYEIAAPEEWVLPDRTVPPAPDREAFLAAVGDAADRHGDPTEPLLVWGWNRYWHGPIDREDLDSVSAELPVVVIQRSFHEFVLNTAGLRWLDPGARLLADHAAQLDLERGHFFEGGIAVVLAGLAPYLSAPERLHRGLRLIRDLVHAGGVTTIADMLAGGTLGRRREWEAFRAVLDGDDVPFRTCLVPPPHIWGRREGEGAIETLLRLPEQDTPRLRWLKAIKTLGDGSFISQLMQLDDPGYIDGHHGEWITPPDELRALIEPYWRAGFDVYHHVNGDRGVDVVLDVLERLQNDFPRADFRFNLEHFGISREDQARRLARLGGTVSANGYYLYLFADRWSEVGIGPERASQMTRLGSLVRQGVNVTLHSDLPMGPVKPLVAVGAAVTRRSQFGRVHAPEQRITLDRALRAVTIDAAWSLRLDREIGSIAAGKRADFVALDADPYEVEPEALSEMPVIATVFEGTVHEV